MGAEAVWKHCVTLSSRTSDAVHAASNQQGQEVLCWEATSKAVHRKHTSRRGCLSAALTRNVTHSTHIHRREARCEDPPPTRAECNTFTL